MKKWKEYNQDKYGVDFYTQTEEFANSVRATYKNKTDEELQNIIKERISTNNKKFGSDYYSQTNNFKDKYKNKEFVKGEIENGCYDSRGAGLCKEVCVNTSSK